MNMILDRLSRLARSVASGIGHVFTDEFRKKGALQVVEFILLLMLWGIYFSGVRQLMLGTIGGIVAAAVATMLVMFITIFVHHAFVGETRAIRNISKLGMGAFMLLAALMTSALLYRTAFGANNANQQAFAAVKSLISYSEQLQRQYTAAAQRYRAAATLSEQRSQEEAAAGGTCGDGSLRKPGVRSAWRASFAQSTNIDATEIETRAADARALATEIKGFGTSFDPYQPAAMQARWSDLTGRLQAIGGDARVGQLVSDLNARLAQANRGIGLEKGKDGKSHVVTCPDNELQSAGADAVAALKSIQPPPQFVNSIVGADLPTALHRIVVMVSYPFGLTKEPVRTEEFGIFVAALFFELMFIVCKKISYSGYSRKPDHGPVIDIDAMAAILPLFSNVMRADDNGNDFGKLRQFIYEHDQDRVRLVVPDSFPNVQDAMAVLVNKGNAKFVGRFPVNDLTEAARMQGKVRLSPNTRVSVYDIPSETWLAFAAIRPEGADGPRVH